MVDAMAISMDLYETYQIWTLIGLLITLAVVSAFLRMILHRTERGRR